MKNKTNTKKKISLYKYHKSKFLCWILVFITEVFMTATKFAGVEDKIWSVIITLILLFASAVFITIWLANALSKDIDKEDELAKANMTKAHEKISSFMLFIFVLVAFIAIFWHGSFNVTIDHYFVWSSWMIFYSLYLFLESGFFLHYDGKECLEEDE